MRHFSFLWPLTAVSVPYIIFEAFNMGLFKDLFFIIPKGHFYIVSFVSILASIIAVAVGIAGRRIRNIKVSFLALSFLSLGLMFSIHGLSTPNFIHGYHPFAWNLCTIKHAIGNVLDVVVILAI